MASEIVFPSERESHPPHIEKLRVGKFYKDRNAPGKVAVQPRRAHKNPIHRLQDLRYLSQPGVIDTPAPFSIASRYGSYNLNADLSSLKFAPRSGSLPRIVGAEDGTGNPEVYLPDPGPDDYGVSPNVPFRTSRPGRNGRVPPSRTAPLNTGGMDAAAPASSPSEPPPTPPDEGPSGDTQEMTPPWITQNDLAPSAVSGTSPFISERTGALVSEQAYIPQGSRQQVVDGYRYNSQASHSTTAVYDSDTTRVIGLRGTVVSSPEDLASDVFIAAGALQKSPRYKRDYKELYRLITDAQQKGLKVDIVGHSLGGSLATTIVENMLKKHPELKETVWASGYNQGTTPLVSNACTGKGCANIRRYRIKGDIVSAGERNATVERQAQCSSSAHGISQFTGVCAKGARKKTPHRLERGLATVGQGITKLKDTLTV